MIRRLRLASGLVMFAYVTTHFVNHSLRLVSVQVMDRALEHIYHYWASLLGSVLLYGAFATHYSLALWALWLRRSLKMPFAETTQLVLGFSIPFFLTDHVLQTRVADTFYGADVGYYSTMLHTYFVSNPLRGGLQVMAMAKDPAWVAQLTQDHPRPAPADAAFLDQLVVWVRYAFVAALLAVLAARLARWHWERRRGVVRLTYPNGRVVEINLRPPDS